MIPVAPSRPSLFRALFASAIGIAFVALSIHSMCRGSFRMRGRETDVTAASEPMLFWGCRCFTLLWGLMALYAAWRDVRFLRRRREKTVAGAYDFAGLGTIESVRRILEIATIDVRVVEVRPDFGGPVVVQDVSGAAGQGPRHLDRDPRIGDEVQVAGRGLLDTGERCHDVAAALTIEGAPSTDRGRSRRPQGRVAPREAGPRAWRGRSNRSRAG